MPYRTRKRKHETEEQWEALQEARRVRDSERRAAWVKANPDKAKASRLRHYRKHPEKSRAKTRAWYWANRERGIENSRASMIRNRYGLSREQYAALPKECAMCGATGMVTKKGRKYRLHVDHCHDTGKVRGVLCHHCNTGIGNLRHNVALLRKAIEYLERTA